jgi:hypothetical protein
MTTMTDFSDSMKTQYPYKNLKKMMAARVLLMIISIALVAFALFPAVLVQASGSGGGTSVPVLTAINVVQALGNGGLTHVTVKFIFSNNVGYYEAENSRLFDLVDQSGNHLSYQLSMWAESTNPLRREIWMAANLEPGLVVTASVEAGILSKNGLATPTGGSKTFTVSKISATPTPRPTLKPTATPTPRPTLSPTPRPTPTRSPTATPRIYPTLTPKATTTTRPTATPTPRQSRPTTQTAATSSQSESSDFIPWVTSSATTPDPSTTSNDSTASQSTDGSGTSSTSSTSSTGGGTGGGKSEPLALVNVQPADQSREIPLNQAFTLTFNKNVVYLLVRTNNQAAITLWADGQPVPIAIDMADDQLEFEKRNDIIVRPLNPLQAKTAYILKIDTTLVAKSGAHLTGPLTLHFYTIGYHAPLNGVVIAIILIIIISLAAALAIFIFLRRKARNP